MKVLVIEDEIKIAEAIESRLVKENYIIDKETDGLKGYYKACDNIYDLIILDIMLPNMNVFEILKNLKEENISSKIIMLTAKPSIEDKLDCFDVGADDYITKPFHLEELIRRVNKELKVSNKKDTITFGDITLNISSSTITSTITNDKIELVCKEFQILEYFMTNPNQILSKDQIYDKIWGLETNIESNNLEAYLSFIRKKLRAISSKVNIKSIRGLGYIMEVNDEKTNK